MTTTPGPISGTLNADGTLKCRCIIRGLSIEWCPLHAAAEEMRDTLAKLVAVYERVGGPIAVDAGVSEARALLARIAP